MNKKRLIVFSVIFAFAAFALIAWYVSFPGAMPIAVIADSSQSTVQPESISQARPSTERTVSARGRLPAEQGSPPTANPRGPFRREEAQLDANIDVREMMKKADEGDSSAAYTVAMKLFNCSILYARYERLQEAVRAGRKTEKAGNKQFKQLDEEYGSCKGLSKDDYEKRFEYIKRAADAGDINAQIDFLSVYGESLEQPEHALDPEWIRSYKNKGIDYLKSAVSKGSIDAMSALAMVYWDGLIVEKNGVLAYAYMYAVARSGLAPSSQSALRMWEQSLSAEEVSRAKAIGSDIYRSCCEWPI